MSENAARQPLPKVSTIALPADVKKPLLMLMLLADTPLPPVRKAYGTYHEIFTALFERSVQLAASQTPSGSATDEILLTIESYDAVQGHYPTAEKIKQADGLLITGSAASAYEPLPWIEKLVSYTASLPDLNPRLKLIGICFGHQIVARAFGSSVEKNAKGWEVGVRKLEMTDVGKKVFAQSELTIHQMHQDHVPTLPPSFQLLGSTPVCAIQGMIRCPTSEAPSALTDIQILTLQGHPEFSPDIVLKVIEVRAAKGVFDEAMAEKSRAHARERDEGVEIGRVILQVMGM